MKKYHKIKNLLEFDFVAKRPTLNISEYFHGIENLQYQFTEKIDGTNIRIHWDGHKVRFGGRTDDSQIPVVLLNYLQDTFIEELFEQKFGEQEVMLYGEGFGGKIQDGKRDYQENEGFILFDVLIDNIWLQRENIEDIAKYFTIPIVPVVLEGTLEDGRQWVEANCINFKKGEKQIEGLVGIPKLGLYDRLGERICVKIKGRDLKKALYHNQLSEGVM